MKKQYITLFLLVFCTLNLFAEEGIRVSTDIPRGRITAEQEFSIDVLNNSISFNLDNDMHLNFAVSSPIPVDIITLNFYIGSGRAYETQLNTGLNISIDNGNTWYTLPYEATGDGWYKVEIKNQADFVAATSIPYSQKNLDELIEFASNSPNVHIRMLGIAPRTFPIFDFGKDDGIKPIHYIIAGEDTWEMAGMWTADAIIRYMIDNEDTFLEMTAHHILRVVPCVSPYSMEVNKSNFVDEKDNVLYATSSWGRNTPPAEFNHLRNEILGVISPTSGPTHINTKRLHWLLNIHSWWAQNDYSQFQSVHKSYSGVILADYSDNRREIWVNQFLNSMISTIPKAIFKFVPAWNSGLARDYFMERYNMITSVFEVSTYNQGLADFTNIGQSIIDNLKSKGNDYEWANIYPPELEPDIPTIENVVFNDNFERSYISPGGYPNTYYAFFYETISSNSPAEPSISITDLHGNRLRIPNRKDGSGRQWIAGDLSSYHDTFNPKIKETDAESIIWTYNVRNTSSSTYLGFDDNQRGFATVLLADGHDFTLSSGYAVIYYGAKSDDTDNASIIRGFRLVKFSGGLNANSKLTTLIERPSNMSTTATGYYSIKIAYMPQLDVWKLFTRLDSSSGSHIDPLEEENNPYLLLGSATDNTFTTEAMSHFGFLNNYSGPDDYIQFYDNYTVRVFRNDTEADVKSGVYQDFYKIRSMQNGISIEANDAVATLYDAKGMMVATKNIKTVGFFESIRQGLYILKVESNKGIRSIRKVIIY